MNGRALLLALACAPALLACGGERCVDSTCTWAGTGQAAFDGDGKAAETTALYWPMDVTFGPDGRAYVADWNNHRIRRVEADGTMQTVIGTATIGDGPEDLSDMKPAGADGTTVNLNHPMGMEFLPDGTGLLVAWHNHKLRTWDPVSGRVRVHCGSTPGFVGDGGPASLAKLDQPSSAAVARDGTIYVLDQRNQRVRRISPSGTVATVVGTGAKGFGGDGGPALQAQLSLPTGGNPQPGGSVALDEASSTLYISDTENHRVRAMDLTTGLIRTVAGTGEAGPSVHEAPALEAALNGPRDVELDAQGRLYIADTENHVVRRLDPATGVLTTVVGSGKRGFAGDGDARDAVQLARPFGLGLDGEGNLYIADTYNHRIRRIPAEELR
jgi:sugar lactone lactonase YvrE